MKYAWSLGSPEFAAVLDRRIVSVLIEYDGPQLVVLRDSRKQWFLGLAADHDASGERWIHAHVTPLELEALCTEGVTMRNAVCKSTIDLVDYVGGRARSLWRTSAEHVPAGILPVRGAYLPSGIGKLALAELKIKRRPQKYPVFRCGGSVVQGSNITFAGLSAVTQALQGLWTAIANAIFPKNISPDEMSARLDDTTLRMGIGVFGSFGIGVVANNEDIFAQIAENYKLLLALPPDVGRDALSRFSADTIKAYSDYLRALGRNGIEVLANWSGDSAFVGNVYAEQAKEAIADAMSVKSESPTLLVVNQREIVNARGFFESFGLNRKQFEFFNTQTGQKVSGRIEANLAKHVRDSEEVRVGHQTAYDVQINVAVEPPVLTNLHPVQTRLFKS